MSSFESDLIREVKKYPILYDFNHPEYRSVPLTREIWATIAMTLNLSGRERALKSKWRSIRDGYTRTRRKMFSTRNFNPKGVRIKYFREVDFLKDFIHHREEFSSLCLESVDSMAAGDSVKSEEADLGNIKYEEGEISFSDILSVPDVVLTEEDLSSSGTFSANYETQIKSDSEEEHSNPFVYVKKENDSSFAADFDLNFTTKVEHSDMCTIKGIESIKDIKSEIECSENYLCSDDGKFYEENSFGDFVTAVLKQLSPSSKCEAESKIENLLQEILIKDSNQS